MAHLLKTVSSLREPAAVVFLLLIGLFSFFPRTLLYGEAIGPADQCYTYAPWRNVNPLNIKPGHNILSDQFDEIIPNIRYQISEIKEGRIPAYTDKLSNGTPLFWVIRHEAKMLLILLLGMVFSFPVAWTLYLILRLLIGGVFFFEFLKLQRISRSAALLGTLAYAFSSYVIQNFGITMMNQYFLLPVCLYAVERIVRERARLWIFVLPVALCQMILSGYPTTAAYNLFLIALYALFSLFRERQRFFSNALVLLWLGVLGVLLCAPAILASLDFFGRYDWEYRAEYWKMAMAKEGLLTLFLPYYFGEPTSDPWVRHAVYAGMLPLFLAFIGIAAVFRRNGNFGFRIFLLGYTAWVFCFAYNFFNFLEVIRYVPVFNASMPNNHIILIPFVVAGWAAIGFDELRKIGSRTRVLAAAAVLMGCFILALGQVVDFAAFTSSEKLMAHVWRQLLVAALCALSIAAVLWRPQARWALTLMIIVVLGDLGTHGRGFNNTVPREAFFPETEGIRFLKENLKGGKMLPIRWEFLANTPQYFGIPTIGGRGFFLAKTKELYRLIYPGAFLSAPTQMLFPFSSETRIGSRIFDAIGIKYVVLPPDRPQRVSRVHAIEQKEWNAFLDIRPGKPLMQDFIPSTAGEASLLAFPIAGNTLAEKVPFEIELRHSDKQLWLQRFDMPAHYAKEVELAIPRTEFRAGERYQLVMRRRGKIPGALTFQWAKGVDILPDGTLHEGRRKLDGDLTFSLFTTRTESESLPGKLQPVYQKDLSIWENRDAFPRAWLVRKIVPMPDEEFKARVLADTFDFRTEAAVAPELASRLAALPAEVIAPEESVEAIELQDTRQRFRIRLSKPALLVIGDNFDHGWRAKFNGEPVEILPVDFELRGALLPGESGELVLEYDPPFLRQGVIIAAAAALLLMVTTATLGRRRQDCLRSGDPA